MTPVRLEPTALRSRVKRSTTEPLRSLVVQEMSFKDISYLELWQPFVQWTGTICAILEEGIMRNNPVKLF